MTASKKAIDRISPELEKLLQDSKKDLQVVQMTDQAVKCPGCSKEAELPDLKNTEWLEVKATCKQCKTAFIVTREAAKK